MPTLLPKYGLFSPYTLLFQSDATAEPLGNFLKRAAIMFEHLVFVPEGLGFLADLDAPRGWHWWLDPLYDGPQQRRQDYQSLFMHAEEFWPDEGKLSKGLLEDLESDLWRGAVDVHQFQADLRTTVNDALWKLIGETKPDLGFSLISAVVGTIPTLGLLGNVKTIVDINREARLNRAYGWLYFIDEARAADGC